MKRTPLLRRTPLKAMRRNRTTSARIASAAWQRAVCEGGRCAVTGRFDSWADRIRGHHVITQQRLRRRAAELGIDAATLLWDPRVGMPVLDSVHAAHHSRKAPIPFEALPDSVHEFAAEYDLTHYLERVYPRHCPDCGQRIINRGAHYEQCSGPTRTPDREETP